MNKPPLEEIAYNTRWILRFISFMAGMILMKIALGQPCTVSPTTFQQLPSGTGTTPASHEIVAPQGGSNVYVAGQWSVLRGGVGNHPQSPGPFQLFGVGIVAGFPGGVIPIKCDCFAAWRAFDAAEAGGQARIIGGWQPYDQGGAPPPGPLFSGLAGQLVQSGAGLTFGQQINLPSSVPIGSRSAVLAVGGKFFAYFPVKQQGVYLANVSTPSGSAQWQDGITTSQVIAWNSSSTVGARLTAAVAMGQPLLAGSTPDLSLHIATIDPATGIPTEVASTAISENPVNLEIGSVNGRTFVFSAEDLSGLRVYEYIPAGTTFIRTADGDFSGSRPTAASVSFVGSIAGRTKLVVVKGGTAFPYLFQHRLDASGKSFIDVYDTHWLVAGGTPILGASLPTLGAVEHFLAYGFDAYVNDVEPAAWVYREVAPSGSVLQPMQPTDEGSIVTGVPKHGSLVAAPYAVGQSIEQSLGTAKVSLACLSVGVTPTPTPTPIPTWTPTPIPGGNPAAREIEWFSDSGITAGCGNGNYCPNNPVTRQQIAVFFWKFLKAFVCPDAVLPPCHGEFGDVPCPPTPTPTPTPVAP